MQSSNEGTHSSAPAVWEDGKRFQIEALRRSMKLRTIDRSQHARILKKLIAEQRLIIQAKRKNIESLCDELSALEKELQEDD